MAIQVQLNSSETEAGCSGVRDEACVDLAWVAVPVGFFWMHEGVLAT